MYIWMFIVKKIIKVNVKYFFFLYFIDSCYILGIFLEVIKKLYFVMCEYYYFVYIWLYVLDLFLSILE